VATDEVVYLTYTDAALAHIELMRYLGETRYGVFDRALVESALARPVHAAMFESADLISQGATLLFGLIKNHPWIGGNKRTATALLELLLNRNGLAVFAAPGEWADLALAIEADQQRIETIADWLRQRAQTF
jgi:death on curing protein